MANLKVINIANPGILGFNTEDTGVSLPIEYAKVANNAVISSEGRLSARKAFTARAPATAFTGLVRSMFETINSDGVSDLFWAAGNKIYTGYPTRTDVTGTLVLTADNWQFVQGEDGGDVIFAVQADHSPIGWLRSGSTWTQTAITYGAAAPFLTSTDKPNCALAAFGRVFVADTATNKTTVWFSEEYNALNYSSGGAGSLDVGEALIDGDRIVALASIGNKLLILCTRQVLIYRVDLSISPTDFTTSPWLFLDEVVRGVGCIARDSVVNTGTDILWLASQGVVSFGRLDRNNGQLPIGNVSSQVHTAIQKEVANATDSASVKAIWWATEKTYLLMFRNKSAIYNFCFKTNPEVAVCTKWDTIKSIASMVFKADRTLWFGGQDTLFEYADYGSASDAYTFSYYSGYLDFQAPEAFKFLKLVSFLVKANAGQNVTVKWAFDYVDTFAFESKTTTGAGGLVSEWGEAKFGESEFATGAVLSDVRITASRSGQSLQIGVESSIQGGEFTIYRAELQATIGRAY